MGSLCFSSATILRCESFTSLESQLLIIPAALELVFSTALVFTNRGSGRRHLLLTAEGWSFFALALLELLSHTIPAVRGSVSTFSIVDIVLGATSFLPIFFYTFYVYLFTSGELVEALPKRSQRVANVLLLLMIPGIIALNELSSFIGISRRQIFQKGTAVLAIGFANDRDKQLWTFFTSLTLALLTAFEAINFCFAFYRLVRAFVDQRRIETTSSDEAHALKGIGWISGGFKLGAIETVIGFAQGGFGGALTRRIVRLLARAILIVGIMKGVDRLDDFTEVTRELDAAKRPRRSRFLMISNPRFSTFRQLSPTAEDFYSAPRANPVIVEPEPEMMEVGRTVSAQYSARESTRSDFSQKMAEFTQIKQQHAGDTLEVPKQRVTVHFGDKGAPSLQMRFSHLDMPSPAVIADSVKARPVSPSWMSMAQSSQYNPSIAPSFAFDPPQPIPTTYPKYVAGGNVEVGSQYSRALSSAELPHRRGMSEFSTRSSNTLAAMRKLAEQFPGPPVTEAVPGSPVSRASTWYPEPQPSSTFDAAVVPDSPEPAFYTYDSPVSPTSDTDSYAYSPPVRNPAFESPPAVAGRSRAMSGATTGPESGTYFSRMSHEQSATTASTSTNPFYYDEMGDTKGKGRAYPMILPVNMEDGPKSAEANPRTSAALLQMMQQGDGAVHKAWTPPELTPAESDATAKPPVADLATMSSSWLASEDEGDVDDTEADHEAPVWATASKVPVPVRVKSVGRVKAPRKATPAPLAPSRHVARGSVHIQPITVPPSGFASEVQIVQGSSSADSFKSEFSDRH
ncbi:unnamed protein product [Mycena citricolor]|uniref:Uncharacterized protein n=1 Tax=Mycena citricolor TaxID=2018698 RepID=A0AAD2HJK7_9AGAR|nr:unnamed protein product [Mycena citricolor]